MRTTSIFQTYRLNNATKPEDALIVRPPQNLRAFRCTIAIYNNPSAAEIRIANVQNANDLSSIVLSNSFRFDTNTVAPPGIDSTVGQTYSSNSSIVLDRRGVGYMEDTFYIWDTNGNDCIVSFIWEGEVQ
jgi:hypothetical protein